MYRGIFTRSSSKYFSKYITLIWLGHVCLTLISGDFIWCTSKVFFQGGGYAIGDLFYRLALTRGIWGSSPYFWPFPLGIVVFCIKMRPYPQFLSLLASLDNKWVSFAFQRAKILTTLCRAKAVGFRALRQIPLLEPPMMFTPELYSRIFSMLPPPQLDLSFFSVDGGLLAFDFFTSFGFFLAFPPSLGLLGPAKQESSFPRL